MRIIQLQDEIDRGEYRIDAHAVAAAIIRRLVTERQLGFGSGQPAQGECS